jgi:hypothetical protein
MDRIITRVIPLDLLLREFDQNIPRWRGIGVQCQTGVLHML